MTLNPFKKRKMNVLVVGSNGMLGKDVYDLLLRESTRRSSAIGIVCGLAREDNVNLDSVDELQYYFNEKAHFDYCINCAAYTDTTAAEYTKEGKAKSWLLNALAPKALARVCEKNKTKLVHISTDYVFSELSMRKADVDYLVRQNIAFTPELDGFPCNVYGLHKLVGEKNIELEMPSKNYTIMRVSWLYGMHKSKSFVHKILRAAADALKAGKDTIQVTDKEFSIPTSTSFVALRILRHIAGQVSCGHIEHVVPCLCDFGDWTGPVSRMMFAKAIFEIWRDDGNPSFCEMQVAGKPICDIKIENREKGELQPAYSVMETCCVRNWYSVLSDFIATNKEELFKQATKD